MRTIQTLIFILPQGMLPLLEMMLVTGSAFELLAILELLASTVPTLYARAAPRP